MITGTTGYFQLGVALLLAAIPQAEFRRTRVAASAGAAEARSLEAVLRPGSRITEAEFQKWLPPSMLLQLLAVDLVIGTVHRQLESALPEPSIRKPLPPTALLWPTPSRRVAEVSTVDAAGFAIAGPAAAAQEV